MWCFGSWVTRSLCCRSKCLCSDAGAFATTIVILMINILQMQSRVMSVLQDSAASVEVTQEPEASFYREYLIQINLIR